MLNGMIRRFAGVASAASLLAVTGLSTASSAPVAAATVDACTVNGIVSVSPGISPVPGATATTFTGDINCIGTVPGFGFFNGGVLCELGSFELGVNCNLSYLAGVNGVPEVCDGTLVFVEVGYVAVEACLQANADVEAGGVMFIPQPTVHYPVIYATFTGAVAIAGLN